MHFKHLGSSAVVEIQKLTDLPFLLLLPYLWQWGFRGLKPTFHLAPLPLFLAAIGLNFKNFAQIYSSTVNQNSKVWVNDFYLHDEILLKFLNILRNVRGISVRANQEFP